MLEPIFFRPLKLSGPSMWGVTESVLRIDRVMGRAPIKPISGFQSCDSQDVPPQDNPPPYYCVSYRIKEFQELDMKDYSSVTTHALWSPARGKNNLSENPAPFSQVVCDFRVQWCGRCPRLFVPPSYMCMCSGPLKVAPQVFV